MTCKKQFRFVVFCDGEDCDKVTGPTLLKKQALAESSAKYGFASIGEKHYCPECKHKMSMTDKQKNAFAVKRAERQLEIFTEKINLQKDSHANS